MRRFIARISPDAYAQFTHRFLAHVLSMFEGTFVQCTHKYLMRMLSARISSWCVCSVHALVPDAHAQPQSRPNPERLHGVKIIKIKRSKISHLGMGTFNMTSSSIWTVFRIWTGPVFGPPGSGSLVRGMNPDPRKTLIPTVLWLLLDFLYLKNDINVPSKINKKKHFF